MQTFLPYPDFKQSAQSLDNRRLGKQRVETKQILDVLDGNSTGWRFHPAVHMWRGYEKALEMYFNIISMEWINRGYIHNMCLFDVKSMFKLPKWFGNEIFHLSHQSNLLRKDSEHYGQYFIGVPDDLPYVWPSKENL